MSGDNIDASIDEEEDVGSQTQNYSRSEPKFLNPKTRTKSFDKMVSDELMVALAMMRVNSISSLNEKQKERVMKLREKIKAEDTTVTHGHKGGKRKNKVEKDFELSGWSTAPIANEKAVLPLDITHEVLSRRNLRNFGRNSSDSAIIGARTVAESSADTRRSEPIPHRGPRYAAPADNAHKVRDRTKATNQYAALRTGVKNGIEISMNTKKRSKAQTESPNNKNQGEASKTDVRNEADSSASNKSESHTYKAVPSTHSRASQDSKQPMSRTVQNQTKAPVTKGLTGVYGLCKTSPSRRSGERMQSPLAVAHKARNSSTVDQAHAGDTLTDTTKNAEYEPVKDPEQGEHAKCGDLASKESEKQDKVSRENDVVQNANQSAVNEKASSLTDNSSSTNTNNTVPSESNSSSMNKKIEADSAALKSDESSKATVDQSKKMSGEPKPAKNQHRRLTLNMFDIPS